MPDGRGGPAAGGREAHPGDAAQRRHQGTGRQWSPSQAAPPTAVVPSQAAPPPGTLPPTGVVPQTRYLPGGTLPRGWSPGTQHPVLLGWSLGTQIRQSVGGSVSRGLCMTLREETSTSGSFRVPSWTPIRIGAGSSMPPAVRSRSQFTGTPRVGWLPPGPARAACTAACTHFGGFP